MKTYLTHSSEETIELGKKLAKEILSRGNAKLHARKAARSAKIFALKGNLGAGKTTFVQGFLKGLGVKSRSASPTFIIMRRHKLPGRGNGSVFHIDAYRLKKPEDISVLGFNEIISDPRNILLIEWPEKIKKVIPLKISVRWLEFRYGRENNERKIVLK